MKDRVLGTVLLSFKTIAYERYVPVYVKDLTVDAYSISLSCVPLKSYEELLKRAKSQLPEEKGSGERFEIPQMRAFRIGVRTIINNFKEVAVALNREPRHLLKYLTNEMATAASFEGTRATFHGKFDLNTVDRLVNQYVDPFIVCPVCKRPDTRIIKEKRLFFLVCEACGARSSSKPV